LNVFQNYQYYKGILHGHRMTFDYYKAIFGKLDIDQSELDHLLFFNRDLTFEEALVTYEYEKTIILENSFENKEDKTTLKFAHSGTESLLVSSASPLSSPFCMAYSGLTDKEYCWVEVKFWAYITNPNSSVNLVNTFDRSGGSYGYSANNLILDATNLELNQWKEYTFHYQTPHIRSSSDEFKSYFWHNGGEEVYIDDLTITKYTPK